MINYLLLCYRYSCFFSQCLYCSVNEECKNNEANYQGEEIKEKKKRR
jgi:hypothetical protein